MLTRQGDWLPGRKRKVCVSISRVTDQLACGSSATARPARRHTHTSPLYSTLQWGKGRSRGSAYAAPGRRCAWVVWRWLCDSRHLFWMPSFSLSSLREGGILPGLRSGVAARSQSDVPTILHLHPIRRDPS